MKGSPSIFRKWQPSPVKVCLLLLVVLTTTLSAIVVRQAPNISWLDSTGRQRALSTLRGQPVIVLIAPSPRDRAFRSQLGQLRKMFERYAAQKAVFIAAFTQEGGVIRSNIPFMVAADGPRVGYEYESGERFGVAFIGRDGNLDYVSNKVMPAQRVYDLINNSFVAQRNMRRP
jgi:AhpC/TSA family